MSTTEPSGEALYEFSIYPFSTDPVFQEGLHSIVTSAQGKSPDELEQIIGKAKAYYFTRTTGHTISWEDYVEWKKTHPFPFPDAPVDPPEDAGGSVQPPSEPTPLTFQQISELIRSGRTDLIPNNKIIPEALNVDVPSDSTRPVRKKPWESENMSTEPES